MYTKMLVGGAAGCWRKSGGLLEEERREHIPMVLVGLSKYEVMETVTISFALHRMFPFGCSPAVEKRSRSALGCYWSITKNLKAPPHASRGRTMLGRCMAESGLNESVVNKVSCELFAPLNDTWNRATHERVDRPHKENIQQYNEEGSNPFMLDRRIVHPVNTCGGDLQIQGIPERLKGARP
jgi:hypothetical protein